MSTFEELGLSPELLNAVKDLGFESPMPVQEQVIPLLLQGNRDLMGLAQTGTGKTAAFGLPLLQYINRDVRLPQGLILAPTRELCLQIAGDLKNFAKYLPGIDVVPVYGGADMSRQVKALQGGAPVIVATPGRMKDLLDRRLVDFRSIHTVVLDEADEMLNMGFKDELDAILDSTPTDRNTWLFSATMPPEVSKIAKTYMHNPEQVKTGSWESGTELIHHICYVVRSKDRYSALKRVVDYNPDIYGIIFCRTRQETKEVAQKLIQDGYNAEALHGDLNQGQREQIMHKFRIKHIQMLVATDVAARGIDVQDITHIINYNLPDDSAVYKHRSGRTGRAGRKGISIAIVNLREKSRIREIEKQLGHDFERQPVPGGREICQRQLLHMADRLEKIEIDHKEIDSFLPEIYEKLEWLSREELIKHFVALEFNRFLDYYKDAEDLNAPVEGKKGRDRDEKPGKRERTRERGVEAGFIRFMINLGHRDSVNPRDLIGLINRCTRGRHVEIGRINLMKNVSWFEVDSRHGKDIMNGFSGVEYNRREISVWPAEENEDGISSRPRNQARRRSFGPPARKTRKKRS